MAQQAAPPRQSKYHLTPSQQQAFNRVMYGVILVGIGVWIGAALFANKPDADNYTTNLYTEFISIAVTVFILDFLNRSREEAREERQFQARLVREAGSMVNDVAVQAINELRNHGWIRGDDGLLAGANLVGANLAGADLYSANLDNTTVLPVTEYMGVDDEGKPIYTPDSFYQSGVTDMRKYTNRDHPNFWQPDWVTEQADKSE